MGETLQSVIPGFNRSLRIESRADRLAQSPCSVEVNRNDFTSHTRVQIAPEPEGEVEGHRHPIKRVRFRTARKIGLNSALDFCIKLIKLFLGYFEVILHQRHANLRFISVAVVLRLLVRDFPMRG